MISPSELSPTQAAVLMRAEPVPEAPERLCLPSDTPTGVALGLLRLGLVVHDDHDRHWSLTEDGRAEHVRLGGAGSSVEHAPGERSGIRPDRATVDPDLGPEEARLLRRALAQVREQEPLPPRIPGPFAGGRTGQAILVTAGVAFTLAFMVAEPGSGSVLLCALFFGGALVFSYLRHRREHARALTRAEFHPRNVIDRNQGRYVWAAMLDERATDMLRRAREAVDTVLGSAPHHEGLLLDRVRNRVVLADTEWTLAQASLRHTQGRERLDANPAVGERSRRAADRARAALESDVSRVESRLRVVEAYAARVREAERELRDRELAAEFDALADHTESAAAADPHHREPLAALVQAQELALEVAAFGEDEIPER